MLKRAFCIFVIVSFVSVCCALADAAAIKNVIFLPLDERFTTRDIFLNEAKLTPFQVLTPPLADLCKLRQSANIAAIDAFMDKNIGNADALVMSAEMFLYGGLLQSRISNMTQDQVLARVTKLISYKKQNPNLQIYLSTVVMRIPKYNGAFEEPWYWDFYGERIFFFSFYLDRYQTKGDAADKKKSDGYAAQIPKVVLDDWIWRRQRNFNITSTLINAQAQLGLFERVYVTLDDNAEYGFNIHEANEIKQQVKDLGLEKYFSIYPGADEVLLTVLARLATDNVFGDSKRPRVQIVYRDPSSKDKIPNYEGQSLSMSVEAQIAGSGGIPVTQDGDWILLVNNFSEDIQQEAPNPQKPVDYDVFKRYLSLGKVIAFADVRYSNGGDIFFAQWIRSRASGAAIKSFSYAGWNTNGNTLGTVVSNAMLLYTFRPVDDSNTRFQVLRFLEDTSYQAWHRNFLNGYLWNSNNATGDGTSDLSRDLPFYSRFVQNSLQSSLNELKTYYPEQLDGMVVSSLGFPWNRTFEISITLDFEKAKGKSKRMQRKTVVIDALN